MNLQLAEYVIAFYSPCDRYYVIYHDQSEVSLIYKSMLYGSGMIPWMLPRSHGITIEGLQQHVLQPKIT